MHTIGDLIESIRSQGVTLEVTQAGRVRYSGPTMSAFYVKAIVANRDLIKAVLELEHRLHLGWIHCETQSDPETCDRYESAWVERLRQYQEACDRERLPSDVEEAA